MAFPLLSSGNYGYPKEQAFRIAVDTITQYVMEHDLTVYLVIYDRHSLAVSRKLFASVEEYIDDHYVAQNDESYEFDRRRRELSERRRLLEEDAALPMLGAVPAPAAAPRTARSLESLMDNLGESFTTRLLRLIDERGAERLYRVQAVQHLPAAFLQNSVQSRLQPQKENGAGLCGWAAPVRR